MDDNLADDTLLSLTVDIVAAHVSNNSVQPSEIPTLISAVFASLSDLSNPKADAPQKPVPAVSVRSSVKPDFLVCLEDGKKVKMLKRYLRTNYDMSPEDYRAKWGLPKDYPMVAPSYADSRRAMALAIGLGRKPAKANESMPLVEVGDTAAASKPPRKRLGIATGRSVTDAKNARGAGDLGSEVRKPSGRRTKKVAS
ncbi:Ros/MucR family transcriptional regulator [Sphingomonas sp. YL-JM2C]